MRPGGQLLLRPHLATVPLPADGTCLGCNFFKLAVLGISLAIRRGIGVGACGSSYSSAVRLLGVSGFTFNALRHRAHVVELRGEAPSLRWPLARPAYGCQAPGYLVLHGSQLLWHPHLETKPYWLGKVHVTQVHTDVLSTHAEINIDLPCMDGGQQLN